MKKTVAASGPKVPTGGRMNPKTIQPTTKKAPQPAKGKTSYSERSTRDAGPK